MGDMVLDIVHEVLKPDGLDPQRARAAIDALKWQAGKLAPKVYGDKTEVTHRWDGDIDKLSIEELQTLERTTLAKYPELLEDLKKLEAMEVKLEPPAQLEGGPDVPNQQG
jgi:hypothetical protein